MILKTRLNPVILTLVETHGKPPPLLLRNISKYAYTKYEITFSCIVQHKESNQVIALLAQGSRPIPILSIIPSIIHAVLERYEFVLDAVALVSYLPRKQNNELLRQQALSMYLRKDR